MWQSTAYSKLTGTEPDDFASGEAKNGLIHVMSLLLTKTADGVIDPKLVLSSVLSSLGTPAAFIGALVPIREAGALAPQIALASKVEASPTRRRFWALGSAVQGLAALTIALSLWVFGGVAAGWAVVSALVVFSLARALCSVTYKDALARSIPKTRRGSLTGAAGSIASGLVLCFAGALASGILPAEPYVIAIAIALAGAAWLVAATVFLRLDEREVDPESDENETALSRLVQPILSDTQFRRFIVARALLTGTALAPPFLLLASSAESGNALQSLGPLMLGSAAASILSSFVWGRLSDKSSRLVLVISAIVAAGILGVAGALSILTGGLGGLLGSVAIIFIAQTAYEGVRAGRKLHLTDMADDQNRTRYTALSNTLIGAVLVAGGALGLVADLAGVGVTLLLLAALSAVAFVVALGLEEVQQS